MTKVGLRGRAVVHWGVAFTVLLVFALGLSSACKPMTEQDKYRRALAWTDVEDVRRHLDGGKDVNVVFDDGDRPIHVVAKSMHGKAEIMRMLLERGADVMANDGDGKTAWDLAWGDVDRKLGADKAALLLALLDAGVSPPKLQLPKGRGLLHAVAERAPSARLATVLVQEHGHAVDAVDDDGWTPLHVAVLANNVEAATGLLSAGADANAKTTATVGKSSARAGTKVWSWRYEAGSHPLDLYRSSARGRTGGDVRKVLAEYGATKNPAVNNKSR